MNREQETGNGRLEIESKKPEMGNQYYFYRLEPHEIPIIKPLLVELYQEIGFKKGMANPDPKLASLINFFRVNPYQHIWVVFNYEPQYPFKMEEIPIGYIWFNIYMDEWEENCLKFEQLVIKKDFRHVIHICKAFCMIACIYAQRCSVKDENIFADASTVHMQRQWHHIGFVDIHVAMQLKGKVDDLLKKYKVQSSEENIDGKFTKAIWADSTHANISSSS